tara:strand:- start:319 stop:972 length:654 start_codon:yes stop_codon:yes gene_type:complete
MNSAIILAGGSGTRFKSDLPKQFIEVNNRKKIIDFSIEAFEKNKYIDELIIVLPEVWIDKFKEKYKQYKLVPGGKERYESSKRGLLACSKKTKNIILHDAARPLITQKLINECIDYLNDFDAVAPFIDINDSLIIKNDVTRYIDRDMIKVIQTPQAFNKQVLLDALMNVKKNVSDDMSAVLEYDKNIKAKFFKGDRCNFKITYDLDLKTLNNIIDEK